MSLENLLNYSVDNEAIQHYLHSLAERDLKVEQRNTHLTEKLYLCEKALVEVHETLHATREESKKQLLLSEQKLVGVRNKLLLSESVSKQTQEQLEQIKDAHEFALLQIEQLRDEVDELQLSAIERIQEDANDLKEDANNLSAKSIFGWW